MQSNDNNRIKYVVCGRTAGGGTAANSVRPVGAPCNICMPSERHAKIYRLNLDGSGLEVVASGIRQIVGMDWHPTSKQLYFTENSRDWLSEDIPQDKFNRVTQPGKDDFGYPYCHQGNV